jgi:hypothetical protein
MLMLLFGLLSGNAYAEKIAGVSVVSPSQKVDGSWVASVKKLNAGWVAVMPYAMGQAGSATLRFNGEHQWWGEKFEGIQAIIHDAKSQGLKVMLKPMVWVHGSWVGAFDLKTEAEWKQWEANYTTYLNRLTEIAVAEGVDMICIGTELKIAVQKRAKFFGNLADALRLKYKGKLTYAANWDDFLTIKLWDKLDYIGIDAYFPLVEAKLPEVSELKLAWVQHARKILSLYLAHKKPVLFTEFGYRSIDLCCWQQWERENLPHDQEVNLQAQVNAYQAFFESFWDQPWFAGVFLWQWYTHHDRAGGLQNSDFTPQNKPAEKTISSWFGKG